MNRVAMRPAPKVEVASGDDLSRRVLTPGSVHHPRERCEQAAGRLLPRKGSVLGPRARGGMGLGLTMVRSLTPAVRAPSAFAACGP